jgi:hypothetical protein
MLFDLVVVSETNMPIGTYIHDIPYDLCMAERWTENATQTERGLVMSLHEAYHRNPSDTLH